MAELCAKMLHNKIFDITFATKQQIYGPESANP